MREPHSTPLSEADMLALLLAGGGAVPPLEVAWSALPRTGRDGGADASVLLTWGGMTHRFVAEIKSRSTPKAFAQALAQARAHAERTGDHPLVVLPFLSPERLDELERSGVSGLDLCGNALVQVPGTLLVLRSGAPNRFRESYPIREVYRGATSLVARALLLRPETESLGDMNAFIRSHGGALTLTTISKALRRLEEDVIIERHGGRARLLQPASLLDKLAGAYRPPKLRRRFVGSTELSRDDLGSRLAAIRSRALFTGQTSTDRYAVMGREERVRVYCESVSELLAALGPSVQEGERFANLELLETADPTVYFDMRIVESLPFASPIQTYVELAAGDARERETAKQVRALILREVPIQVTRRGRPGP